MHTNNHNNGQFEQKNDLPSIGDMREALLKCDVSVEEIAFMRSALKRVDEVIAQGMLDFPANERLIFERLKQLSPAMAGMTDGSFANLKSRTRKAFRLLRAQGKLSNPRSRFPLTGEWGALQATLDMKAQRATSRLFHFAAGLGVLPHKMSDAVIERFGAHLRDEAMVGDWEGTLRSSIKAWNNLAASREDLPRLTPPPVKRTSYWIPVDEWPKKLVSELEAFLESLSTPSDFLTQGPRTLKPSIAPSKGAHRGSVTRSRKVLKPGTVKQYRFNVSVAVSALVHSGVPMEELSGLGEVFRPVRLDRALGFQRNRAGGRITDHMVQMALRALVIARWYNFSQNDIQRLEEISFNVRQQMRDERGSRRGMTAKNRALLDRLDDQRFADQVQLLPLILLDRALKKPDRRSAPALVRTALAIEILLICSVRRANLVDLELGKSIRKIGHGKDAFWVIERDGKEVKNEEDLRFKLPGQTVALLETYLRDWRPKLCPHPSPWLFPAADGSCIDPRTMAYAIGAQSKRVLGIAITPHQFRHISAELYLKDNPEGIFTVSQHLAHCDVNTTKRYYARPQQRQASRHFQEHILRSRETARIRIKRTTRRKGGGGSGNSGFDERRDLL